MIPFEANFCLRCGTKLQIQEYQDGHPHPVCPSCGWVFFPDPKVAAGVLVLDDGMILLVKRHFDPMKGLWTLPAGYINAGEDPQSAAERECLEETGLVVRVVELFHVITGRDHPRGADVVLIYRAEVVEGKLDARDDADEAAFFPIHALPPLAFRATEETLLRLSKDRAKP
jgi:ADP-ribose pyrophosphatase YjhB (NUDIX family)